jgi:hypothetical protein
MGQSSNILGIMFPSRAGPPSWSREADLSQEMLNKLRSGSGAKKSLSVLAVVRLRHHFVYSVHLLIKHVLWVYRSSPPALLRAFALRDIAPHTP